MKLQLVLALLAVQYNNAKLSTLASVITDAECEKRMLSVENMAFARRLCPRVGSSPKLSKVLLSMGLPEKVVSVILSAPNFVASPHVSSELEDLLEQGDSKHYNSCQRTGSPLNEVRNEVKFLGKSLWLFVIGKRMSLSSEGFLARAKIRLLTKDLHGQEPAAFYIERPYGQHATLLQNLALLHEWVGNWCEEKGLPSLPILIAPVWQRDNGGGRDFQSMYGGRYNTPLYCPSAEGGYQDTMTHGVGPYDFFEEKGETNIVMMAYKVRPFSSGVYLCSLKESMWNPQMFSFQHPPLPKGWRGVITPEQRTVIKTWISLFGYPQEKMENRIGLLPDDSLRIVCSAFVKMLEVKLYKRRQETYALLGNNPTLDEHFLVISQSKLEVKRDVQELGFFKPIDAVNGWIEGKIEECLSKQTLLNFWLDTLGFPEKGERFKEKYQCFTIIHKGQKFMVRFFANGIGLEIALEVPSDGLFPDEKTVFSYNAAKREYRVHYSLPELGFCKAVPIITYKVNDSLWVTGPMPTK